MLSDIFSFSFTLLLPNWLLISIRIYSGIARFPCDSMAFLFSTSERLHRRNRRRIKRGNPSSGLKPLDGFPRLIRHTSVLHKEVHFAGEKF